MSRRRLVSARADSARPRSAASAPPRISQSQISLAPSGADAGRSKSYLYVLHDGRRRRRLAAQRGAAALRSGAAVRCGAVRSRPAGAAQQQQRRPRRPAAPRPAAPRPGRCVCPMSAVSCSAGTCCPRPDHSLLSRPVLFLSLFLFPFLFLFPRRRRRRRVPHRERRPGDAMRRSATARARWRS